MSNSWHPDEAQLLAYLDGELPVEAAREVSEHSSGCEQCRARAAEIQAISASARSAMRAHLPPPPAPWADLRPRLNQLDAGRVRSRRPLFPRVNLRWVAAAAALLVAVLVIRFTGEQTVSAAELLQKASFEESSKPRPKRVRVKTRNAVWIRNVGEPVAEDKRVAELFAQTNLDWLEPLSPRAFAIWRGTLRQKDDRVRILHDRERFYEITTSTPEGALAQASITIRAADLRAVKERFEFRNDEFVEITEAPEAAPSTLPEQRLAIEQPGAAPKPQPVTPADEVRVVAALHSIGADLGEPIEIAAEAERIVVAALVTRPERQQQIRTALAGIPKVELRFESPEAVRAAAPAERESADTIAANPVHDRLAQKLGNSVALENFTDYVMDLSEAAMARAYALRALAQRFPAHVEASLAAEDRETLDDIKADHTAKLMASARAISEAMKPLGAPGTTSAFSGGDWRNVADTVLDAAQKFDRAATEALGGHAPAKDPDAAIRDLASSASTLLVRADALQARVAASRAQ